jgi:hypothetical protein
LAGNCQLVGTIDIKRNRQIAQGFYLCLQVLLSKGTQRHSLIY